MMVRPERYRYLASIAQELNSQANRVRDLIGDKHWFSDGHHKEQLLGTVLQRHLPSGVVLSRGFVIDPIDPAGCSKEQDILIIDAYQEAPVFHQGELAICFPANIIASISVKTVMDSGSVKETFEGLSSLRQVMKGLPDPRSVMLAGFFYEASKAVESDPRVVQKYISDGIRLHPCKPPALLPAGVAYPSGPDMLCGSRDLLYKLEFKVGDDGESPGSPRLLGYRCPEIAAALFIAQLLAHVAARRGLGYTGMGDFVEGAEHTLLIDERLAPDSLKRRPKTTKRK